MRKEKKKIFFKQNKISDKDKFPNSAKDLFFTSTCKVCIRDLDKFKLTVGVLYKAQVNFRIWLSLLLLLM